MASQKIDTEHVHTHTSRSRHCVKMRIMQTLLVFICVCVSRVGALTQIATFGNCILSLDAAFEVSSVGICSTTSGALYLSHKGIRSLAPGMFTNMSKMT